MILGDVEPSCEEDADCPDGETCDSVLFVGNLKACRGTTHSAWGLLVVG